MKKYNNISENCFQKILYINEWIIRFNACNNSDYEIFKEFDDGFYYYDTLQTLKESLLYISERL